MADSAYTLLDFKSRAPTKIEKAVIQTWREKSPILERLKFQKVDSLEVEMLRTKVAPTATWVSIGEDLPNMKGTTESIKERIHKMGGLIDIPREYTKATSLVNERGTQEQMASEAMAFGFNNAFVNGNPETDEKSIVGVWYRLKNLLDSGQTVLGASLDISPDTATATWYNDILDKLEALRDACEGHDCDAFLLDAITKSRIEAALRRSGLLSHVVDHVGQRWMRYGESGPLFLTAGYQKMDAATKIIAHVEAADGSALTGGACTSIYALKFGKPYLFGFHLNPIRVEDKGELEDGVNLRTVVDWTPGIAMAHPRSIARLVGIVAA